MAATITCRFEPIHASLDRLQEGHYCLHQMEENYHQPESFKYSAYSTIRVLGDTYEVVYGECVKKSNDRETFKKLRKNLLNLPQAEVVRDARNTLSHSGNLTFVDRLAIGNGSVRKMRNSMPARPDPDMSTIELCRSQKNFWQDEDFQSLGYRRWYISEMSENVEAIEYLSEYWLRLSVYVKNTLELLELGKEIPSFNLDCRSNPSRDFRICPF